jgi:hypothetical protein
MSAEMLPPANVVSMEAFKAQKNEQERSTDGEWYKEFSGPGGGRLEAYTVLGPEESAIDPRAIFDTGQNPIFIFPKINAQEIMTQKTHLEDLSKKISADTAKPSTVKTMYLRRINTKILEKDMILDADKGNNQGVSEKSQQVFSAPETQLYNYALIQAHTTIEKGLKSDNTVIKEAAERLKKSLPAKPSAEQAVKVSDDLMEEIRKRIMAEFSEVSAKMTENAKTDEEKKLAHDFDEIVKGTNPDREFVAPEIAALFNGILATMGATRLGWKSVVTNEEKKTSISADQDKKTVEVPKNKKEKSDSLRGLIAHELFTHVKRGINGEKSGLQILSAGLDEYEPFEEGIATARETAAKGKKMENFGSISHYLIISLKTGMDGKKRTFAELAQIMKDYFTIQELSKPESERKDPEELALRDVTRAHRGIKNTGEKDGAAFTKDLGYLRGRAQGLQHLDKNRQLLDIIDFGKFNYTDPEQVQMVTQLVQAKSHEQPELAHAA